MTIPISQDGCNHKLDEVVVLLSQGGYCPQHVLDNLESGLILTAKTALALQDCGLPSPLGPIFGRLHTRYNGKAAWHFFHKLKCCKLFSLTSLQKKAPPVGRPCLQPKTAARS